MCITNTVRAVGCGQESQPMCSKIWIAECYRITVADCMVVNTGAKFQSQIPIFTLISQLCLKPKCLDKSKFNPYTHYSCINCCLPSFF